MFQKRSEGFARVSGGQHVGFEQLESRRLMSATASAVIKSESILPAETVKPAILGPSAAEGRWKGDVKESNGTEIEAKIVVTGTRAELIIGSDTFSASLTSAHFESIRKGTFDVKFTLGSASVTVDGVVGTSGLKIAGTYSISTGQTGSFAVKKYSDVD